VSVAECRVVELRRYALRSGARETLIELFERELIEPQERLGLFVLGQFRDLDDRDSFVWLRGFQSMDERRRGLEAFYGGPVWRAHRAAANATMTDSDDVLLLRPARPGAALLHDGDLRPEPGAREPSDGLIAISTYFPAPSGAAEFPAVFQRRLQPALRAAGAAPFACLRTEPSPNDFPALPVREGEEAFVTLTRFDDAADHAARVAALERSAEWRDALRGRLARAPHVARLAPTARSLLGATVQAGDPVLYFEHGGC
jgi:heme-degrading monooxygenase HmoA